ncbi:MAG: nickel pincer cofactor biosynthesis protein LarB [Myxococcota bacterium]
MKPQDLQALLERVAAGETAIADAQRALAGLPFEDLGYARVDHHRHVRTGLPEVVYGPGKTVEEIAGIVTAFHGQGQTALVTRLELPRADAVISHLAPNLAEAARYHATCRLLVLGEPLTARCRGEIAVVSAGTADGPVAEEAAVTLELFGHPVRRIRDVGVAGLHRILSVRESLESAEVVIVVAGMEGALPSVVKGLVTRPVIGVPTSVGFGANFQGLSALLGMLASCTPGMTVVNIDNGFGAAYSAALMNTIRDPLPDANTADQKVDS